jgi:hypothetical protein
MYREQEVEEENPGAVEDDGFVDDIPESAPPKKGARGRKPAVASLKTGDESPAERVLSEDFHDLVGREVAAANKELDIF